LSVDLLRPAGAAANHLPPGARRRLGNLRSRRTTTIDQDIREPVSDRDDRAWVARIAAAAWLPLMQAMTARHGKM
jgi:hypothetical protein